MKQLLNTRVLELNEKNDVEIVYGEDRYKRMFVGYRVEKTSSQSLYIVCQTTRIDYKHFCTQDITLKDLFENRLGKYFFAKRLHQDGEFTMSPRQKHSLPKAFLPLDLLLSSKIEHI